MRNYLFTLKYLKFYLIFKHATPFCFSFLCHPVFEFIIFLLHWVVILEFSMKNNPSAEITQLIFQNEIKKLCILDGRSCLVISCLEELVTSQIEGAVILLMVSRDWGSRTCSNFICHHCKARESREPPKPAAKEVHLPTVLRNRNTR